ncbi:early growth response protein [Salpingoeca rosetta]|uniref:Early growth response protein n=1 Tax=Salpingoeca rosetta (strain ATCC 50818 / BSB-021) TaxID=946362 RepID=F2UA42_SALR5|nr:early growth response protein [Salpingoeca rosetta]EGD73617.1 early growth response protein [Salpingoeca rosetta]|eukprot:XP_004993898.1 early growth response protein [Salpingoeca rosetta]
MGVGDFASSLATQANISAIANRQQSFPSPPHPPAFLAIVHSQPSSDTLKPLDRQSTPTTGPRAHARRNPKPDHQHRARSRQRESSASSPFASKQRPPTAFSSSRIASTTKPKAHQQHTALAHSTHAQTAAEQRADQVAPRNAHTAGTPPFDRINQPFGWQPPSQTDLSTHHGEVAAALSLADLKTANHLINISINSASPSAQLPPSSSSSSSASTARLPTSPVGCRRRSSSFSSPFPASPTQPSLSKTMMSTNEVNAFCNSQDRHRQQQATHTLPQEHHQAHAKPHALAPSAAHLDGAAPSTMTMLTDTPFLRDVRSGTTSSISLASAQSDQQQQQEQQHSDPANAMFSSMAAPSSAVHQPHDYHGPAAYQQQQQPQGYHHHYHHHQQQQQQQQHLLVPAGLTTTPTDATEVGTSDTRPSTTTTTTTRDSCGSSSAGSSDGGDVDTLGDDGAYKFVCPHPGCNKVYRRRNHLQRHSHSHKKTLPFVCPECDRGFHRKDHYEYHRRVHSGDKPFVCDEKDCGRSFRQRSALTRHKKSHIRERERTCTYCNRVLSKQDDLYVHICTMHGRELLESLPAGAMQAGLLAMALQPQGANAATGGSASVRGNNSGSGNSSRSSSTSSAGNGTAQTMPLMLLLLQQLQLQQQTEQQQQQQQQPATGVSQPPQQAQQPSVNPQSLPARYFALPATTANSASASAPVPPPPRTLPPALPTHSTGTQQDAAAMSSFFQAPSAQPQFHQQRHRQQQPQQQQPAQPQQFHNSGFVPPASSGQLLFSPLQLPSVPPVTTTHNTSSHQPMFF